MGWFLFAAAGSTGKEEKKKVQNHNWCVQSTMIHKSMNYPDLA